MSLDSTHKKLKNFHKKYTDLKNVTLQIRANKNLKEKVLDYVGDFYNELHYIYKEKYNEEKYNLNTKNKKYFDHAKFWLTDDYQYKSENEEEQQISKKFNKKELPIKTDANELNELIIKEETDIDKNYLKNILDFKCRLQW